MIKNIIFDVGEVLIGYRWPALLMGWGLSYDQAKEIHDIVFHDPLWAKLDAGAVELEEVLQVYCGAHPDKAQIIRDFILSQNQMCQPRPKVWELLPALKEKGYRLFILSNYSEVLYQMHTEGLPFHELMDGEVISCRVKASKPDEAIYRHLLDEYNLVPQECLFLDDRPVNLAGAEALGIQTWQVQSEEGLVEFLQKHFQ